MRYFAYDKITEASEQGRFVPDALGAMQAMQNFLVAERWSKKKRITLALAVYEEFEKKYAMIPKGKNGEEDCFFCGANDEICSSEFHGLHGLVRVCETCFEEEEPTEEDEGGADDDH